MGIKWSYDEFWASKLKKKNPTQSRIGQNLETKIIGIHPVHRNSLKQPRI